MKKKTTFGLLGVLAGAGAVGGLTALGNYYYDSVMIPRKHDPASDTDPEDPLFLGRRWLKESPVRRDIFTASVDGLRLHAHVLGPASPEGHHWAVCIHGYADAADSMGLYARHYYEQGYGVLLPDLRGHGESEGSYVGLGWDDRLDIVAWISRIIHRDPKAQIVLHGVSMGAATALMTAGGPLPDNVRAVVSDCAFSNAEDLLKLLYSSFVSPRAPAGPALGALRSAIRRRAKYDLRDVDPIKAVRRSNTPTLFIHGVADELIPSSMMADLYEAAACPGKELLWVTGAAHARSVTQDPALYWSTVDLFLKKHIS